MSKEISHQFLFYLRRRRCNFSPFARYSLKFTCCSLLVVKSLVNRGNIFSLLVAEVARCKKWVVTFCKIYLLMVPEVSHWKKSPVTRCKIRLLLVAEVACCKKSLVTRRKTRSLPVAEVARWKESLVPLWKICLLLGHKLLVAKNYSSIVMKKIPTNVLFKANKDKWILFIYSLFSVD